MRSQNPQNYILLTEPQKVEEKITKVPEERLRYKFVNGQRFILLPEAVEKKKFRHLTINFGIRSLHIPTPSDFLTSAEINDVETSFKEIKEGRIKRFRSVDDFLEELKK